MSKQLTLDQEVTCLEANPFPGDAVDEDEVNYENVLLRSEDGDVEIRVRAKGKREVRYFERFEEYQVVFRKAEDE